MSIVSVTVTTQFGQFSGFISLDENSTREDALKVLKTMVDSVNSIESLSLETAEGVVHVFPQAVLNQSVISASVID